MGIDSAGADMRRDLPEKVIVGYATECNEQVVQAVRQGVNVVVWAFYNLTPGATRLVEEPHEEHATDKTNIEVEATNLNLACIRKTIADLDAQGFDDTVHLASMGGWNGPHLDSFFATPEQWYDAWKAMVGSIFHGMDMDWEGNDNLSSRNNYIGVEELDFMGEVFYLAKKDGYIVTIAPAQSYLDIQSSMFGLYLNTTEESRPMPDGAGNFSYFGKNAYAYWLAKYGDSIDLVMIQFYESYSRASYEIYQNYVSPENYLQQYVWDLNAGSETFWVDFSGNQSDSKPTDLSLKGYEGILSEWMMIPSQKVSLPLSKLVWGFGNAWAQHTENRHAYFPPECVQAGYSGLWDWMLTPRGMMFWEISLEGQDGIYYAKELNQILNIRPPANPSSQGSAEA